MYYIDFYSYATKSLAMNEFLAPRYGRRPFRGSKTLGEIYLEAFGLPIDPAWRWGGVVFIGGFACIMICLSVVTFALFRFDRNIGSIRAVDEEEDVARSMKSGPPSSSAVTLGSLASSITISEATPLFSKLRGADMASSLNSAPERELSPLLDSLLHTHEGIVAARMLPFEPASIAFRDIKYTVQQSGLARSSFGAASSKTILHGICGFAQPGRMLALMGASGAGTLF